MPQALFNIPKDLTLTLVSGNNVQMRHRIIRIDRLERGFS